MRKYSKTTALQRAHLLEINRLQHERDAARAELEAIISATANREAELPEEQVTARGTVPIPTPTCAPGRGTRHIRLIEFLVLWSDGTWTTKVARVPEASSAAAVSAGWFSTHELTETEAALAVLVHPWRDATEDPEPPTAVPRTRTGN